MVNIGSIMTYMNKIRQTNTTICKKNMCKPFQKHASVLKEFLCEELKSPTLLIILRWVFLWKYAKMHERYIARPRMPICRVIKISDHTKCWSGESPHCWAAVSRAPKSGPEFHDVIPMQERGATSDRWHHQQALHDVTSSVVCHSWFVKSRNSGLNSRTLETAQQSIYRSYVYHFLGFILEQTACTVHNCICYVTCGRD
jgi:hypothetical protein